MRKRLASEILERRYESHSSADKVEDKYSNEKQYTVPLQEKEEDKIIVKTQMCSNNPFIQAGLQ